MRGEHVVEVTRTFTVGRAPNEVVAYLADFGNATEWDPGTESCEQTTPGPVAVGTRWHNVSSVFGLRTELEYELVRVDPDRVVFTGRNDSADTTDDIAVRRGLAPGTSDITYHAVIDMHGAAKLGAPAAKLAFDKIGHDVEDNLVRILSAERQA